MKSFENNDLFNFISMQVKILKLFGLWFYIPHKVISLNFMVNVFIRIVLGFLIFVLPTVGQGLHILVLVISRQTEIQDIASEINMLLMEIMISVQLLDLQCRRQHFSKLLEYLNVYEFSYTCFHTVLITGWNGFQNLPVEMNYIVIDVRKEPVFTYVFVYQIVYKYLLIPIYASIQTMRWSFLLCAIAQLEMLLMKLKKFKDYNIEDYQDKFKKIVLHHCSIIRFVKEIENVFGGQLILFFILNACVMCTTLLQFVSSDNIFSVIYSNPWITLPQFLKKYIIITNNQRSLVIRAGKLIPVSIQTFAKVMNWSYQGFALFNQMRK
nr:uncharacterized protein LOC116768204 [Danaus plexippus plexippus]